MRVRQAVRDAAVASRFGLLDQTKIVTAASELARNALVHGGGGMMTIERLDEAGRMGLRLTFLDEGPGIADIEQAMREGFSTGTGLGLGLSGARKLMSEFQIESAPDRGTKVVITRWK